MFKNIKSRNDILVIIFFIAMPILIFGEVIFSDIMLFRGDGAGYLAAKEIIKNNFFKGELPLWNHFNASGTPFAADVQNAVFYPRNILILIFPVNMGMELLFSLHLSIAGIGMYFFLKNVTKSRSIGFVGGLVLMFSNILIIRFDHINILASLSWFPFIVFVTDKLLEKKRLRYAILLGVLMAVQFLAGFPQIAFYSDIVVFGYYMVFCFFNKRKIKEVFKEVVVFVSSYLGLIAIQLFPLAQLILFSQRGEITYNVFVSYSQSWKMLIQMIFPSFWGGLSSNLNIGTEFPTDIYIGIIPFLLCIYGIRYHFKDIRVKIYLLGMVGTYLFACCSEFDIVGKILFRIPIINSFRVPSRMVPFTVIIGLMLAFYSFHLLIKNRDYINYLKINIVLVIISSFMVFLISFFSAPIFNVFNPNFVSYYNNFGLYFPAIFLMCCNIGIIYLFRTQFKLKLKHYYVQVFCILIGLITIVDVYYLNRDIWVDCYRIYQLNENTNEKEFNSEIGEYLENLHDKDEYRIALNFIDDDDYYAIPSDILGNNNIFHQFMALQSYTTFQNPSYNEFCQIENSKFLSDTSLFSSINSSLISSLSAKYIVKKGKEPIMSSDKPSEENIMFSDASLYKIKSNKKSVTTHDIPLKIEENKTYLVSVEYEIDKIPLALNIDLYGGKGSFDSKEQEVSILSSVKEGSNIKSVILNSGDSKIPKDTWMRILLKGDTNLYIKDIKVYDVTPENSNFYKPIYTNEDITVYENPDAKPILYAPKQVESIDNVKETVANNMLTSDLANCIYTDDTQNYTINQKDINVTNINVDYNNVSGHVVAKADTFIVMTQTWYPGWKAYIDGKEVPIHLVNGIVQGIEVTKGEHDIDFRFTSSTTLLGALISITTMLVIVCYFFRRRITYCIKFVLGRKKDERKSTSNS